mmetsp:Transcript_23293/g.36451  ORF Transcript_23293/g.36451 Transcript_23293/m.36451 type:complete len:83 (-) Transcript_23293:180-428(-)|eukprot:CAMPEP_0184326668 /NCGR_PEP_ID=MMETSP1049-20130417/142682_1 /TAXON_ID=77928 /ORGANISM="Proteomonas sulcata, Strain CCMP704" /LENGTH=82 /DNA_ID=CAMNT_0026648871 /DNA_START=445 /DNA_END=693 /DNA_ORIENTATION=-
MLGPPFETPSGGAWDGNITYMYTPDPEYGDSNYPLKYTELWNNKWRHFDNLDHVRPNTGVPTWNMAGAWELPGRTFPGPAAS